MNMHFPPCHDDTLNVWANRFNNSGGVGWRATSHHLVHPPQLPLYCRLAWLSCNNNAGPVLSFPLRIIGPSRLEPMHRAGLSHTVLDRRSCNNWIRILWHVSMLSWCRIPKHKGLYIVQDGSKFVVSLQSVSFERRNLGCGCSCGSEAIKTCVINKERWACCLRRDHTTGCSSAKKVSIPGICFGTADWRWVTKCKGRPTSIWC